MPNEPDTYVKDNYNNHKFKFVFIRLFLCSLKYLFSRNVQPEDEPIFKILYRYFIGGKSTS